MPQLTAKKSFIKPLRTAAILEGISYLLLLGVTMPLKYLADMPMPNKYVGYAHGFLFIWYISLVIIVAYRHRWSFGATAFALAASLIPGATFFVEAKMLKNNKYIS